jgi:hypothetical protein
MHRKTLADYLNFAEIDTVLASIPTSENVAELLKLPSPANDTLALMFTKFLTLMDHFFLHYSSRPCSPQCPCHRPNQFGGAIDDQPPAAVPAPDPAPEDTSEFEVPPEEKEGKEEKRKRVEPLPPQQQGQPNLTLLVSLGAAGRASTPHTVDKSNKFRFDVANAKHRSLLAGIVPIFLNIFAHIGVILHGQHTCGAERYARER